MTLTISLDEETVRRMKIEAQLLGLSVEEYAASVLSRERPLSGGDSKTRNFGWAAGMGIKISDDFDEPLEEFKDYM